MKFYRLLLILPIIIILLVEKGFTQIDLIPQILSGTNAGTEFYFAFHHAWEEQSEDNYISIYVISYFDTEVRLHIPKVEKTKTKRTTPGKITEFRLLPEEAFLFSLGTGKSQISKDNAKVFENAALYINSDEPVVCYGFVHFKGKSEGFMIHPIHTLGFRYIISAFADKSDNKSQFQPGFVSLVGVYDNTRISLRLTNQENIKIYSPEGEIQNPNSVTRVTLNKGDVCIVGGLGANSDLSGSVVSSNKPLAAISGSFCAGEVGNCNYMIEQEVPTSAWGYNSIVTPIEQRKNFPIVRIFSSERENIIRFDGIEFAKVPLDFGKEGQGFLNVRTGTSGNPYPINISAFYPINVVQYNPASDDDKTTDAPFKMQVVPVEQFNKDIIFSTVGADNFKYEINYFNLVYVADEQGTIPDDLIIKKLGTNPTNWEPVSNFAQAGQPINSIDMNGRKYNSTKLNIIEPGIYRIKSSDPLMIYKYGNSRNHAFGTTAWNGLRDLNSSDTLAPVISFSTTGLCDISGTVRDTAQPGAEPSNLAFVKVLPAFSENFTFTHSGLTSGLSRNVNFELRVINCFRPAKALLVATDRCGNVSTREIIFTPKINLDVTSLDTTLNLIKSGRSRDFHFTLKNESDQASPELNSIILNDNDPQFELFDTIEPGTKIAPKATHNFRVRFRAHDLYSDAIENLEKVFTNSISVITAEEYKFEFGAKVQIEVANPRIIADDVDFATQSIGIPGDKKYVKVSNPGKTPLLITGYEIDSAVPFEFEFPPASEQNPFEIAAFGEHLIPVRFNPTEEGEFTTILRIISDAYVIKDTAIISAKATSSSIKEFHTNSDFSIHPNPATDYIEINPFLIPPLAKGNSELASWGINEIKLLNTLGQCVIHLTPPLSKGDGVRIDVSHLPSGVYFVRIGNRVKKFVRW